MSILRTLHVYGAVLLLGGVTTHLLLRPAAARGVEEVRRALYNVAWRVQVLMVYTGSALTLVSGVLLWLGQFKLLTGWLLLGVLLFLAAMSLDGAFLAPTLRRARQGLGSGEGAPSDRAAATTIQLVAWLLLVVVVFLMVARPF